LSRKNIIGESALIFIRMKHIIIGIRGQIGNCVNEFLKGVGETEIVGIEVGGLVFGTTRNIFGEEFDMMHICIRFTDRDSFIEDVKDYIIQYPSKHIVVYSTVLPGVCEYLGENVVHSPVEGRHPNLIGGFRNFQRLVAGKSSVEVGEIFSNWGLTVVTFPNARVTELGKLLSTTRYGINLLFADMENKMCKEQGISFEDAVLSYQKMYNEGYEKLGEKRFNQPLLTPPDKHIGGHCVVPNADLLMLINDNEWIKQLANYNK
jgi:hypothetical protein